MFEGLELRTVSGTRLRVGGDGSPILLLHGHPQTHVMWHAVAPALARRHTVVVADLPGYGGTRLAATGAKSDMARLLVDVMDRLGYPSFSVAGHDRGGRCAYRLALDHPDRVERLAVLDIVPTSVMWDRADKEFGLIDWHWYFLAQAEPFPEDVISANPDRFYFRGDRSRFDPAALDAYLQAVRDPSVVHGMCEDYRAGATIDDAEDRRDQRRGRRIRCPVLALWAGRDELARWFDVLEVWRGWADDVTGRAIDSGHFMAEERPDDIARELLGFFEGPTPFDRDATGEQPG